MMSALAELFENIADPLPLALFDWGHNLDAWCKEHQADFPNADRSEINLDLAVFTSIIPWSARRLLKHCPFSSS